MVCLGRNNSLFSSSFKSESKSQFNYEKKIMFGVDFLQFQMKSHKVVRFLKKYIFLVFEKLSLKLIISLHLYTLKICWFVLSRSVEHPFGILWTRFGYKSLFQLSSNRCSTEYIIDCNIQCKTFDGKSFTLLLNRWKTIV